MLFRSRDEVVKLLLGCRNVNPNITDDDGRTPLLWASMKRHYGVARLLLGCEDVNPNTPDNYPMDCNTIRTAQGANFLTL